MAKIIFQKDQVSLGKEHGQDRSRSTIHVSDRELLRKRSKKYMDVIASLDNKTLTGTQGMNDLLSALQEEFGTAHLEDLPVGIVSKCFLGQPYEVHILDLTATQIVEHYKRGESMPGEYEKARTLAMHNAYAVIEVYRDKMILIREDGTTTKL
ncbi:MAG: hypothetical protein KDB87_11200 [Flavobacteriales bacterium]|nr:hypothetical protein [Flavobacteriales bacterium]